MHLKRVDTQEVVVVWWGGGRCNRARFRNRMTNECKFLLNFESVQIPCDIFGESGLFLVSTFGFFLCL